MFFSRNWRWPAVHAQFAHLQWDAAGQRLWGALCLTRRSDGADFNVKFSEKWPKHDCKLEKKVLNLWISDAFSFLVDLFHSFGDSETSQLPGMGSWGVAVLLDGALHQDCGPCCYHRWQTSSPRLVFSSNSPRFGLRSKVVSHFFWVSSSSFQPKCLLDPGRMPLVLAFFTTGDRVNALFDKGLQEILQAVILEPGKLLEPMNWQAAPVTWSVGWLLTLDIFWSLIYLRGHSVYTITVVYHIK